MGMSCGMTSIQTCRRLLSNGKWTFMKTSDSEDGEVQCHIGCEHGLQKYECASIIPCNLCDTRRDSQKRPLYTCSNGFNKCNFYNFWVCENCLETKELRHDANSKTIIFITENGSVLSQGFSRDNKVSVEFTEGDIHYTY